MAEPESEDVTLILPQHFDLELSYYLSGPMSGIEEYNFPAFVAACTLLRSSGIKLASPHEIATEDGSTAGDHPWYHYVANDVQQMLNCRGIIMLPGWPQSKGARLELDVALSLDFATYFLWGDILIDMHRRV